MTLGSSACHCQLRRALEKVDREIDSLIAQAELLKAA